MFDVFGIVGGLATGIAAFFVAKVNSNNDRQKFYENKITEILEIQETEIKELKSEITKLVQENKALTIEVIALKRQLEQRGMSNESVHE